MKFIKDMKTYNCSSWKLPPLSKAEIKIRDKLHFLATSETEQCKIIPYYQSKYNILFEGQMTNFHYAMHDVYWRQK